MAPVSFPALPKLAQQPSVARAAFPSGGGVTGEAGRGGGLRIDETTPPLRATPPVEGNTTPRMRRTPPAEGNFA